MAAEIKLIVPGGSSNEMMDSFGSSMQRICIVTGFIPQLVVRLRQSKGKARHKCVWNTAGSN